MFDLPTNPGTLTILRLDGMITHFFGVICFNNPYNQCKVPNINSWMHCGQGNPNNNVLLEENYGL